MCIRDRLKVDWILFGRLFFTLLVLDYIENGFLCFLASSITTAKGNTYSTSVIMTTTAIYMHINERRYPNCEHKKIIFNFNTTTSNEPTQKLISTAQTS